MRTFITLLLLVVSCRAFADVTVLSFRCDKHTWGAARLIGEVRNDSKEVIRQVRVVANFRTADGTLIESKSGYAEIQPLMIGQASGFHVTGPENPLYARCEIAAVFDGHSKQLKIVVAEEPKPASPQAYKPPAASTASSTVSFPKIKVVKECPKQINRKYYRDCNGAMIEGTAPE